MKSFNFPKDFLWGTATAGHQIEGNNTNSDWWAWEKRDKKKDKNTRINNRSKWPLEASGIACDSYNRYEEDFDYCVKLNNNAVRIGVEWARIEPQKGVYDQKEIDHYKKVLKAAKDRNLKTYVTLFHFVLPKWLADQGGWTKTKTIRHFEAFSKKCAQEFGDLIDVYLTINEPQVYAAVSYLVGMWPPQKNSLILGSWVQINLIRGHIASYKAIKKVNQNYKVGIVKNIVWHQTTPEHFNPFDFLVAKFLYFLNTDFILRPINKYTDLIGVNYYFTNQIKNFKPRNPNDRVSDFGWWLYPKGLEKVLIDLKRFNKPIYITENGISDAQDRQRTWFLKECLKSCANAIEKGADLRGYFHWSLMDNYEWAEGYKQKFGLIEINRHNNLERKPRPSFNAYAQICKSGTIN